MTTVEMSLDEIIAQSRKNKQQNGGFRRGGHSNNNRFKKANKRQLVYRDLDNPGERKILKSTISNGGNYNTVRINLSNLAPSVTSADLEELFEEYNVESATVHYDEHGESLGTGDVFLRKRDALRALKAFNGVALDNEILRMVLVDGTTNITSRGGDFLSPRSGSILKPKFRQGRGSTGSRSNDRRTRKTQKTTEELDAELDAYMKKSSL